MPASPHDISSTDDRSMVLDVSSDDSSDEDAESDYHSCLSYLSDEDEECTEEDHVDGELEILQWNHTDKKYEQIPVSDVQDLFEASMTNTGWILGIEYDRWFNAVKGVQKRSLDALAVLAETVGGVARAVWRDILSEQENHGLRREYYPNLQAMLILIMASRGAWNDTDWWEYHDLYIPSQGMYHYSFTSSFFEGRMVLDLSLERPSKDLAEVMRIALLYFREMNARIEALSKLQNMRFSDSASIFGPTNMVNIITCLDIAESVTKLVPVFGNMVEGACGILRKTVQAAENARAARNECRALAEYTAFITLAILNEIGPESKLSGADLNRICDLRQTINTVESKVQSLSKLGRLKYFASRGRINAEIMDLRTRVDNARIAFGIRSDISTMQLLTDLKMMQTRLESRVDYLCEGQKTTHNMLRTILVEVRGRTTGDAYVEEAAETEERAK